MLGPVTQAPHEAMYCRPHAGAARSGGARAGATVAESEQAGGEARVVAGIARNTSGPSADNNLSGYKCDKVAVLGQGSRIVRCISRG